MAGQAQARGISRGAAVASLVMVFEGFLSGWDYFYSGSVGLLGAAVSLQMVAKFMKKDATAPSVNRFAEPAWRTLKFLFAIS